jgi:hypothetical protein
MVILEAIMWAIINSMVVSMIVVTLVAVFLLFKNKATAKAQLTIANAIYAYQLDRIENQYMCGTPIADEVDYSDMEPYEKTFKRFYDWGYTRILPKDKFEIIKPFIEKE